MPRKPTGRPRGGQRKDTQKWAVSVKTVTIAAFEQAAGKGRGRRLAADMLDKLAETLV